MNICDLASVNTNRLETISKRKVVVYYRICLYNVLPNSDVGIQTSETFECSTSPHWGESMERVLFLRGTS